MRQQRLLLRLRMLRRRRRRRADLHPHPLHPLHPHPLHVVSRREDPQVLDEVLALALLRHRGWARRLFPMHVRSLLLAHLRHRVG